MAEEGSGRSPAAEELQAFDVSEPLLLLGSCNDWGHDWEDTKRRFRFSVASQSPVEVESYLQVTLPADKRIKFQIISARSSWSWRLYPAGHDDASRDLSCEWRSRALLCRDEEDKWAHGRNFRLEESISQVITIWVLLTQTRGIFAWYRRGYAPLARPAPAPSALEQKLRAKSQQPTLADIGALRAVGKFCRWRIEAEGLLLSSPEPELAVPGQGRWVRHRLCFRMHSKEVEFQIISDNLGFKWRLFPRWNNKSGRSLPRGDKNSVKVTLGGQDDGHGKNFRVAEDFLTIVTLCVWIEVIRPDRKGGSSGSSGALADALAGRISVTYTVEDTGLQVAIGSNEYHYPPHEVSSLDCSVKEMSVKPEGVEEQMLAKSLGRADLSAIQVLKQKPVRLFRGTEILAPVRVAAMLMLLPSTLGECPGVFKTYLQYHLLAPRGPRLAHIFIFIDRPPPSAKQDAVEAELEASSRLSRWLAEDPEAEPLRPLVTLLDGGSDASVARAECRSAVAPDRHAPGRGESICEAAKRGELGAKQILNMERSLALAEEKEIDWLICNLDADEALLCSGQAGYMFAHAPDNVLELQLVNHEAVPEAAAAYEDCFLHCTLFKRNPFLLDRKSPTVRRCIEFWGQKALDVTQDSAREAPRPVDMYFTGYDHGKAAIRVPACRSQAILPSGAHRWDVYEGFSAVVDSTEVCILHYNNCQGDAGIARKYSARVDERWNPIRFHKICQELFQAGDGTLRQVLQGVAVQEGEQDEVQAQLDAGVCLRSARVRDACRELAFLG